MPVTAVGGGTEPRRTPGIPNDVLSRDSTTRELRITKSGRGFRSKRRPVWNLIDADGEMMTCFTGDAPWRADPCGQPTAQSARVRRKRVSELAALTRAARCAESSAWCAAGYDRCIRRGGEAGMAEAVAERVRRYIFDGSDQDLRRLLSMSEFTAEMARAAFRKVGLQEEWKAIDCGCGPIGGLAVMAEMAGPAGRIVGVDFNEAAVQRARTVVSALELGNVEVIAGDLHELDPAALGGPFDLAYTRLFLMHQADPLRTLRSIAGLLRPGGWLVAQEALRSPAPRSHPHLEAMVGYWDLVYEVLDRAGVPPWVVEDLPRSARQVGLEVAGMDGCFLTMDPELGFELHAASLAALRERAVRLGIASGRVDDLMRDLRAAKDGGYEWVSSGFVLDLTLRKPVAT